MSKDNFAARIKKQYNDEGVYIGVVDKKLWSTGVYALDRSLGGGIPSGMVALISGVESSGKSSLASKIAGVVSSTNYETGRLENPGSPGCCKVLYIDQENTLDIEWCSCHNYFPQANGNEVMSFDSGNQVIDVVNAAIQSKEFSLIVIDSLEALVPKKDLEKSSEDVLVGSTAKMINHAWRVWNVSMRNAKFTSDKWWQRPTLLAINQLRDAIGSTPMPAVLPGGKGQKYAPTVMIQMNSARYSDDNKLASIATLRGVVKKNKQATPRAEIEFEMAVRNLPDQGLAKGQVDNIKSVLQDVRKNNLWTQEGKKWKLFDYEVDKQVDFKAMMQSDANIAQDITQKVVEAMRE